MKLTRECHNIKSQTLHMTASIIGQGIRLKFFLAAKIAMAAIFYGISYIITFVKDHLVMINDGPDVKLSSVYRCPMLTFGWDHFGATWGFL